MLLVRNKLFNPDCVDKVDQRRLFGGETSNVLDLNNVKYQWAPFQYKNIREAFWVPQKYDLASDINHYGQLSNSERRCFDTIISYLYFLDSIQVNNLTSNFVAYSTAPEFTHVLIAHAYFEGIHSESYKYCVESLVPAYRREDVIHRYRTYLPLMDRNKEIAKFYQQFQDNPTDANLITAFIANYILEGLLFYNSFLFFFNLATKSLFPGVVDIIRLINKDESYHVTVFAKVLQIIKEEYQFDIEPQIREMFDAATTREIEFFNGILNNDIIGLSEKGTEQYTKHLANNRLRAIGLSPLYEDVINPYRHLERISNLSKDAPVKGNFFEASQEYSNETAIIDDLF